MAPISFDFRTELATCGPDYKLDRPINVALDEANDCAAVVEHYWQPLKDEETGITRPGLNSSRLKPDTAAELRALVGCVHEQRVRYQAALSPGFTTELRERAGFLLFELSGALEYHLDDGVETDDDARLEHLETEHADPDSIAEMALALEEYAAMADPLRHQLDGVGGFEMRFIDESKVVAGQLRALPPPGTPTPEEAALAMDTRNRYLELLTRRVREVRRAVRYVFRRYPDVVRRSTSAYVRRRRAAARRAAAVKVNDTAQAG